MPALYLDAKYEKLIEGLERLGYTENDLKHHFRYMGGDFGSHRNYFRLLQKQSKEPIHPPPRAGNCVCGHVIINQGYGMYEPTGEMHVFGSCCIESFFPKEKSGRTCALCEGPHRNSATNLCNVCRVGRCMDCHQDIAEKYRRCWPCNAKHKKECEAKRQAKREAQREGQRRERQAKREAQRRAMRWDTLKAELDPEHLAELARWEARCAARRAAIAARRVVLAL